MQKSQNRRGLAWGAIAALVSSLFVAAPAATADETGVVVAPYAGTSTTILITEPFALKTRLGSSVDSDRMGTLRYQLSKPAGYVISYSTQVSTAGARLYAEQSLSATASAFAAADTISAVITPTATDTASPNVLVIQPFSASASLNSVSPAVAVTVTAFLDLDASGTLSAGDPRESHTITFAKWSALSATAAITNPVVGATRITGSSTVNGAVNWEQLNYQFKMYLTSTNDGATAATDTVSSAINPDMVQGNSSFISKSADIAAAVKDESVSAVITYNNLTLAVSKVGVGARTIQGVTVSGVASNNLRVSGATTAEVRTNTAVAFQVWPYSGSKTASVAVAPTFTVATTNLSDLSNDKYVTIEGVKYTQSSKLPTISPRTLPAGKTTVDVATFGLDGDETIVFTFRAQNYSTTYTMDINAASFTLENGDATAATTPGKAVSLTWDVEDQWGVASALTNQRVVAYFVGDSNFSASATASYAVSGGKVTVLSSAPSPAAATGSTQLRVTLQSQNVNSGLWTNDETENVTVVVSSVAQAFTTSNIVSVSASISYAIASDKYSWSAVAMSGVTSVGGTDVVVTGPAALYFKDGAKTASGTITVRSDANGAFSFNVASAVAGTHSVTLVIGDVTTTSVVVISPATHDSGKTVVFDQTEIYSGETATITGRVLDAVGNPVATGTTASVAVKWTGKGLPFNFSSAMATDADGEFSFNVLVLSGEVGEGAVSATYKPAGAAVSSDNVTTAKKFDIVAKTSAPASDQKITVGTFKGYVAIYTKGYMGQKLSAKVAGKWLVVDPIAAFKSNDYSRTVRLTGAGYTITVDLYIDGVFVRSEVVTTK